MKKAKILIVEDETVVAMELQASLEDMGYSVTSLATSGTQAIGKAENDQPDLVLMDIMLNDDMTGIEAAHHIFTQFDIPIIYLTANSDTETLEKAKVAEPFGYLLKPYNHRELHSTIEMALYKHEMEQQRKSLTQELQKKIEEIKILQGLLPTCMYCRKIKDDEGYWERFEKYISEHSEAEFSHGICPECFQEHHPDAYELDKNTCDGGQTS